MDKAEKRELVSTLHDAFAKTDVIVVAHYAGLTVAQMTKLRRNMKAAGGTVKVAKNRIAKLALVGTDANGISDLLKGQTVLAYSKDPVGTAKVATMFAKEHDKLVILGAAMGKVVLDSKGVKALAELPSLDVLRSQILGLIQGPATAIARLVNENGSQLARVIKAHAEKRGMTAGQFALNWVLNNRLVTAVLAGPRTEEQWREYLGALDHKFDAEDEALIDSMVAAGHTSTPGYTDPKFPILGRVPRA